MDLCQHFCVFQDTAEIVEMQSHLTLAELVKTIGSLPDLMAGGDRRNNEIFLFR